MHSRPLSCWPCTWSAPLFAYRSLGRAGALLGWGFSLYVVAELVYVPYHLDWTVFLFAHTISEVLDLVAFVLVFAWATRRLTVGSPATPAGTLLSVRWSSHLHRDGI
jgi:hypothetical protein